MGGAVWVFNACLVKCNTIKILVKEVIVTRRIGTTASAVKISRILKVPLSSPFPLSYSIVRLFAIFNFFSSSPVWSEPGSRMFVRSSSSCWLSRILSAAAASSSVVVAFTTTTSARNIVTTMQSMYTILRSSCPTLYVLLLFFILSYPYIPPHTCKSRFYDCFLNLSNISLKFILTAVSVSAL